MRLGECILTLRTPGAGARRLWKSFCSTGGIQTARTIRHSEEKKRKQYTNTARLKKFAWYIVFKTLWLLVCSPRAQADDRRQFGGERERVSYRIPRTTDNLNAGVTMFRKWVKCKSGLEYCTWAIQLHFDVYRSATRSKTSSKSEYEGKTERTPMKIDKSTTQRSAFRLRDLRKLNEKNRKTEFWWTWKRHSRSGRNGSYFLRPMLDFLILRTKGFQFLLNARQLRRVNSGTKEGMEKQPRQNNNKNNNNNNKHVVESTLHSTRLQSFTFWIITWFY